MLRNSAYMGREKELKNIHTCLEGARKLFEPTSCAIQGTGGIGKTQTALEFTYRHQWRYNAIFWIAAIRTVEVQSAYGAIGRKLQLFDTDGIDQSKIEKVHEWLQETGGLMKSPCLKYR